MSNCPFCEIAASIAAHEARADATHDAIAAGLRIAEAHIVANAGAELEASQRRAARLQTRIDAARAWARQHLNPGQQGGLLAVLRGDAVLAAADTDAEDVRAELAENTGVTQALRRQRDEAETALARLRDLAAAARTAGAKGITWEALDTLLAQPASEITVLSDTVISHTGREAPDA